MHAFWAALLATATLGVVALVAAHRLTLTRRAAAATAAVVLTATGLLGSGSPSVASTPGVTVPAKPDQTVTITWKGTIPAGANPTSSCSLGATPLEDHHPVTFKVPAGAYDKVTDVATFSITWTPPVDETASDEILTVVDPHGGEVGSSDTSATTETVAMSDFAAGTYDVVACGFANSTPQPYTGKLVLQTKRRLSASSLASAPSQGLQFSAGVPVDPQREESEPLIEIDRKGRIYTCGPTGGSTIADFAQVSTDGGDQFHMIGQPPRGQQSAGGGGDCALATAPTKNARGDFAYAYAGLTELANFATAASPDGGHTITGAPLSESIPGVDRQWLAFTDDHTVLLSYNQQAPRNAVVQKSTDGGLSYGPAVVGAPSPDRTGPLRVDTTAGHNPGGKAPLVYFPWGQGDNVDLAVSYDGGSTFKTCLAAVSPGTPDAGFVTADHDSAGNIYIVYAEETGYHTWLTALPAGRIKDCTDLKRNPGFTQPVQVDRDAVRTTVFPWVTAGGAPGRVAVAFYGTETKGNPNVGDFKASWDVYVNQSLDALAPGATFSQVKATTHPFHYDSICLNGLGCDLALPPGDRSLADFFAIAYDKVSGRLEVVFDQAAKKPDEAEGHVSTPVVVSQIAGPSNGGGLLPAPAPGRLPLRRSSVDPAGDALVPYSAFSIGAPPPTPAPRNAEAADLLSVAIDPGTEPGFDVTMKVAGLSDAALNRSLTAAGAQSLVWTFRFVNGYQASSAVASWSPSAGFGFGFNDYTTTGTQCPGTPGTRGPAEKCQLYPGDVPLRGRADQRAGTITLHVPARLLHGLAGGTGDRQRPKEVPAGPGTRFYDATAFSMANVVSPTQDLQSWMTPLDNTPAMDFLLPAPAAAPGAPHASRAGLGSLFVDLARGVLRA